MRESVRDILKNRHLENRSRIHELQEQAEGFEMQAKRMRREADRLIRQNDDIGKTLRGVV